MKAYWFDNLPGDQREPHNSGRTVDPAYLDTLGIKHYELPDDLDAVNAIAKDRNYKNRDEIEISPSTLPGYEEKVKNFFHEHLHEDEEIRYILGGGGYFDVRNKEDEWVRIRLERGDLMIMPAGIYHRFTTDEQNVGGTLGGTDGCGWHADFLYSTQRPSGSLRKIRNGLLLSVARRRMPTSSARST